jgi:N-acetylneuraminic acid mutarotase
MKKRLANAFVLCGGMIAVSLHAQAMTNDSEADRAGLLPPAPVARSNWAVARAGDEVFAFYGIGAGKRSSDIARDIYALNLRSRTWRRVGDIPVAQGRLGSAAVTIGGKVYVVGGYSVSPEGEEVSTPEVFRFDPATGSMSIETTMPTPVDDSVALSWRDRWIVLVSGWHDTSNVADVQIYDTKARRWEKGTPWPGTPVFGHAGGLVDDVMVVCDGVTASKDGSGKNRYTITNACWQGQLDVRAPGNIYWRHIFPHPGVPLYRAGATGAKDRLGNSRVVFAGGTHRPYNYNGIGYDHVPAEPSSAVFAFDPTHSVWTSYQSAPEAGMDFRGLIAFDDTFVLLGGMDAKQAVTNQVVRFTLHAASTSK